VVTRWAACPKNRGSIPGGGKASIPVFEALLTNMINGYRDRLTGWSVNEVSNHEKCCTVIVYQIHIKTRRNP
jgi:hypothetical protein